MESPNGYSAGDNYPPDSTHAEQAGMDTVQIDGQERTG
jgi:hypothetical protein